MSNGLELPAGMRALGKISSEISDRIETEVPVLVVVDNTDLRRFSESVYEQLTAVVGIHGGSTDITEEDLVRYFVTAIKVRVEHTTLPRVKRNMTRTGMSVHEPWALPVNMAYFINAIGQATYGPASTLIYPVWDQAGDQLTMTPAEQQRMTRKLRALSNYGVRVASAIEAKREGVVKVMVLTFMNDTPEGEWVSPEPFGVIDALTASIIGLRPSGEYTHSSNPLHIPPYRMGGTTVARYRVDAEHVLQADIS